MRLNSLKIYLDDQQNPECQVVIQDLRAMPEIEDAGQDSFWNYLLPSSIKKPLKRVEAHLRYAANADEAAETFTSKIEHLKLARRKGKDTSDIAQSLAGDVRRLSENIVDKRQIDLEVSPENIPKTFGGLKVDSFLAFARQLLGLHALADYHDVAQRQFCQSVSGIIILQFLFR